MIKKPEILEFVDTKSYTGYDIHEVMNFISEKYGFDCYDVYDSGSHFDKWCDKKHYGDVDPEGKKRSHSNIWFKEYQRDKEGEAQCPKYVSVLDWFIEENLPDQEINEFEVNFEDLNNEKSPDYIKDFAYFFFAEFDDNTKLILSFE